MKQGEHFCEERYNNFEQTTNIYLCCHSKFENDNTMNYRIRNYNSE